MPFSTRTFRGVARSVTIIPSVRAVLSSAARPSLSLGQGTALALLYVQRLPS